MAENIIATVGFQVDTSDLAKLNKQLDDIQTIVTGKQIGRAHV